jgi:NADH:ubiquinone oxidoreductase subunit 4 (subunit M)
VFRFVWPLFPDVALTFAPFAMGLGVLSVLYGETYKTFTTYHKQLEKAYLTRIQNKTGVLPRLNPHKI